MKKDVKPFSNNREAREWESKNCNVCSRKSTCYCRIAVQRFEKKGVISWFSANYIGVSRAAFLNDNFEFDHCELSPKCKKFNAPTIIKKKARLFKPEFQLC